MSEIQEVKKSTLKTVSHDVVRSVIGISSGIVTTNVIKSVAAVPANPVIAGLQAVGTVAIASTVGAKTSKHTIEELEEIENAVAEIRAIQKANKEARKNRKAEEN